MTRLLRRLILPAATAVVGLLAAAASGQTFSNLGIITINDNAAATPYPVAINVVGGPTSIGSMTVTLTGLSQVFAGDVDIILVGPTGAATILMSDCGGNNTISGVNLTFRDLAPPLSASEPSSGDYAPTNINDGFGDDTFPAPAPVTTNVALSTFNGTNANGLWQLYVRDDLAGGSGSISGGWSITFLPAAPSPLTQTSAFTYQGKLENGGSPVTGTADLRFSLWTSDSSLTPTGQVGSTITRNGVTITNGLFTTLLDFGFAVTDNRDYFLQVEARTPAGSGAFTTLLPRQRLTGAVNAQFARTAINASALNSTGRIFIGGGAGAASNSPGLWLRSPAVTGTDKAFIGLRDDDTVGFFSNTTGWDLTMDTDTGFTGVGLSGLPALAQLDINGTTLIRTSAANALAFGPIGDFAGTAENSDAIFFQRVNTSAPGTNISVLRLALGDDGATPASLDAFSIGFVAGGTGAYTERIRFQADGSALKPGGGAWAVLSDPRKKHDVAPLSGTLDKILKLRGYSYLYNDDAVTSGTALPGTQIGLMADEVALVFPDWVSTNNEGTRFVTERSTTALMVEALRDLRNEKDAQLATQKEQIAKQQQVIDDLTARLAQIEAALKASQTAK